MKVIFYNASGWWYLLEDQGRFFMDFSLEYFGTTKGRVVEIRKEDIDNLKMKKRLLPFSLNIDPNDQVRLMPIFETAEYISTTSSPHCSDDDLSGELLQQVKQAIESFNCQS